MQEGVEPACLLRHPTATYSAAWRNMAHHMAEQTIQYSIIALPGRQGRHACRAAPSRAKPPASRVYSLPPPSNACGAHAAPLGAPESPIVQFVKLLASKSALSRP